MTGALMTSFSVVTKMNKPMRRGAKTKELAVALGIAQIEQAKLVGFAVSAQDANLRHIAACEAMARSNIKDLELMAWLRDKRKSRELSPEEMSKLVNTKRRG